MITIKKEEELLALSGLQHLAFCERQWALIHLEGLWAENRPTMEGRFLHERVNDPFFDESRGEVLITRSVPLVSYQLGVFGIADVVEFYPTTDTRVGVELPTRTGLWRPAPVEYKRGYPKPDDRDLVQLCAQAICLEEMLGIAVDMGYMYYWRPAGGSRLPLMKNCGCAYTNWLERCTVYSKKVVLLRPREPIAGCAPCLTTAAQTDQTSEKCRRLYT